VVKIEHWIYDDVPNVRVRSDENARMQDKPLEDHFGPGTQVGPAFDGHRPSCSLLIGMNDPDGTESCRDIPPDDSVNSWMGTKITLEKRLEASKVSRGAVHHILDALGRAVNVRGQG